MARSIAVVGRYQTLDRASADAVRDADLIIGAPRLLNGIDSPARRLELSGDLTAMMDAIASEPGAVCVLASGDPGFFGIVRPLAERFGPSCVHAHPAPSSVSLAFARLGVPWDDAVVVSAHGRSLEDAALEAAAATKVAVLVSPEATPAALGARLLALGASHTSAAVCTRLGLEDERLDVTDLAGLAAGDWDPLSVVVLLTGDGVATGKSLRWGRPTTAFTHRAGMITKAEVRAAVLGKLDLPPAGVLWDVGAGSGSVAVECALLVPGLSVIAVEQSPEACATVAANAGQFGAAVRVVHGAAPAALEGLPDPDRVFVGGGGIDVLEAALARLTPTGRLVATFAALDRAAAAAERLGHLVQVAVSRGRRLDDGGWRLEADNPVFVAWGPQP